LTISHARLVPLTLRMYNQNKAVDRYKTKRCFCECNLCKEKLVVGEIICTKKASCYTKWYHQKCAEKVNLI
jgi:hypothetical protein